MGNNRDLFKKIGHIKGTFHARTSIKKDSNSKDLTEAEEIKKKWQEYRENYMKKVLMTQIIMMVYLEPDILEYALKWALESITTNKASRSDRISAELFKVLGFPDSSVGKESACNAGDLSSIPGLGRSTGEGIGYSLQYSWASLVPQLVENPPAIWKTWI